jgi:protein-disulfide isomerase
VSIPAAFAYSILFAASWTRRHAGPLKKLSIALSTAVVAAGFWFIFLQYAVIHSWCRFCLATHAFALFSAFWLLAAAFRSAAGMAADGIHACIPKPLRAGLLLGLLGFAALIAGQFVFAERLGYVLIPASFGGRSPMGRLTLDSGRIGLEPRELPMIGPSSARGFVVGLYDYTCTHCRRLHPLLREAQEHFAGRMAFVMLPVPLEADCNPMIPVTDPSNRGACDYARLALAVCRGRPEAFREYDDWLFAGDEPPTLAEARARAEQLMGKAPLEQALGDPWVGRQIATDVRLYIATSQATNSLRLPQLIFADAAVSGSVESAAELERIIAERTPLTQSEGR